jgi:hypothetical protein
VSACSGASLERLRTAFVCPVIVPISECRDRNLRPVATARIWSFPPLQSLAPLEPSKSNRGANPPKRGHSPNGCAGSVSWCSGASPERLRRAFACPFIVPFLECRDRNLRPVATARSWSLPPLQALVPLEPSKSNRGSNPPKRGYSPNGCAGSVSLCSGASPRRLCLPACFVDFGVHRLGFVTGNSCRNLAVANIAACSLSLPRSCAPTLFQPLQSLEPLQSSKSNVDANPLKWGHWERRVHYPQFHRF